MDKRVYNRNKVLQVAPQQEYVTTSEALKILGVSDVTFHKYRKQNKIAPVGKKLNAYLFSRTDIQNLNNKIVEFY